MFKWLTKLFKPAPAVPKVVPETPALRPKGLSTILKRAPLKPSCPKPTVRKLRGIGTLEVVSPKQPTPVGLRAVECWEVGKSKPTIYLVPDRFWEAGSNHEINTSRVIPDSITVPLQMYPYDTSPSPIITGGGGDFGAGGASGSWSSTESSLESCPDCSNPHPSEPRAVEVVDKTPQEPYSQELRDAIRDSLSNGFSVEEVLWNWCRPTRRVRAAQTELHSLPLIQKERKQ